MTSPSKQEIERIARGLSGAQRGGLLATESYTMINFILFHGGGKIIPELRQLGLISGVGDATSITPTGLAVRAYLQSLDKTP